MHAFLKVKQYFFVYMCLQEVNMKTIIAGSRTIFDYALVKKAIEDSGFEITEVVCGCAKGIDTLGEQWAVENSIPVKYFPADWKRYGRAAGHIRNEEMARYADALIAIWDGNSLGTKNMVQNAAMHELKIYAINTNIDEILYLPNPFDELYNNETC